jgi:hypothetical protein
MCREGGRVGNRYIRRNSWVTGNLPGFLRIVVHEDEKTPDPCEAGAMCAVCAHLTLVHDQRQEQLIQELGLVNDSVSIGSK